MEIFVKCESGHLGESLPSTFSIGQARFEVAEVIDKWLGSALRYFKVLTTDGSKYILCKNTELGYWELTFFCDPNEVPSPQPQIQFPLHASAA